MSIDVSVIIVNYNTKKLTRKCIDSIFEHTYKVSFEIILVDNASTDGSVELFKDDKRIQFIKSEFNIGFGNANNLGYKYSKGRYVFFLNSDTLLLNNAIYLFFNKLETSSSFIGCLGCLLQDASYNYVHSYADFPSIRNLIYYQWPCLFHILGCKAMNMDDINKQKSNFFQVDYITGADLFIRRCVIDKYGLFDSDFFMYYEETELQYRYKRKGISSYIYSEAKIIHLEGMSSSNIENKKRKNLLSYKSQMLYVTKTQPLWKLIIFKLIMLVLIPLSLYKNRFNFHESVRYCLYILS